MSKAVEGAAMIGAAAGLAGLMLFPPTAAFFNSPLFYKALEALVVGGIAMEAGAAAGALTSNRGMEITTRQPAAARQVIYGEQRVGGTIVYCSTSGSKKDQYNLIIVIAGHTIDSLTGLFLDGRKVYFQGSGVGWAVRNGVGFGGIADSANHTGPDGNLYNFGGTGHAGIYCEARYGDQAAGDVIGGMTANDATWGASGAGSPTLMGCAYVYIKLEYDPNVFPSLPEIKFGVRGKNNIWDPRTGLTGYSSNWALVMADVIRDTQYGVGDIDAFTDSGSLSQLIAAANVCDELVNVAATGGTERRYCTHYHFDASTAPGDVMNAMLTGAAGRISQPGGEWYLWPAYWQGPSFTFDANALTGEPTWEPYRSQKDLFNRVNGTYVAANWPWNTAGDLYNSNGFYEGHIANTFPFGFQPTNFPQYAADPLHGFASDQYLNEDSGVKGAWSNTGTYAKGDVYTYAGAIYKSLIDANTGNQPDISPADWVPYSNQLPTEIGLRTVLSITQAQRVAKITLKRNRYQGSGTFPLHLETMRMQVTDVLQFTWDVFGWTEKTLEVEAVKLWTEYASTGPELRCEMRLIETGADVYQWDYTTEELSPYDVPALPVRQNRIPAPPTGMTLTSSAATAIKGVDGVVRPRIEVQWTTPADVLTQFIQVQLQGTGGWVDVGTADVSQTLFFIADVVAGSTYNVRIRGVRANGAVSDWVELDGFTVTLTLSTLGELGVGVGSLVGEALGAGVADIVGSAFTARVGGLSVAVSPGNYPLNGLTQGRLYYVYYDDPTFAGGAVTAVPTQNKADFVNVVGRFLIDSIVTPTYAAPGSTIYRPSQFVDSGSRTTLSPASAFDGDVTTYATVSGAYYRVGSTSIGECTFSGFPRGALSYSTLLHVHAAVTTGAGVTCSADVTWTTGSGAAFSVSATAADTDYTVTIPSGVDLATVQIVVTADGSTGSGSTNAVGTIHVSEIFIQ